MNFSWQVNELTGEGHLQEINKIVVNLPEKTTMKKVVCKLTIPVASAMFFNGYQTWTYSPEYTKDSVIYDNRMPKFIEDKYKFRYYGDYHFINYSKKKGMLHGFSYCYFRDDDKYKLFASLDEEEGYTMMFYNCETQELTLKRDCEGVIREGEYQVFNFYYGEGSEDEVFDSWFKALGIKPITNEPLIGYSSWYNRYENIDSKGILQDLEGCKKVLSKGNLFQIDDGWEPTVGDWLEADKTKFPEGMKAVVDKIHQAGFEAGLWLAPFACTEKSDIYKNHQDWLLLHEGKPWINGSNWGGFYSLDLDNPHVIKYLEEVFNKVFNEWGFDLVKLDFLYAGAPFGDANKTRAAKMIEAVKLIRRLCKGKKVIGCGVPLWPSFGQFEYCRIGCDVSLDWDDKPWMKLAHRERVSSKQSTENTINRHQLNGRAFLNDPDVFFLRDTNIKLTKEEKEYVYSIAALLGGVLLTSDDPSEYDEAKINEYHEVLKLKQATDIQINRKNNTISYKLDGVVKSISIR